MHTLTLPCVKQSPQQNETAVQVSQQQQTLSKNNCVVKLTKPKRASPKTVAHNFKIKATQSLTKQDEIPQLVMSITHRGPIAHYAQIINWEIQSEQ